MANGLQPSYVQIEYTSPYAPHIMTVPTLQWNVSALPQGEFETWNLGAISADTMVNNLVNALRAFWKATTTFNQYTIYNFPTPTSDPNPVASNTLTQVGNNTSTAQDKATQQTVTWRTTQFGLFKTVLLDVPITDFNRVPASAFTAPYAALLAAYDDMDAGWSGRDNFRIVQGIQAASTLNEKLRREYRMQ